MKNAVITGATKGIGRAIAEEFVRHGYNLCICSRSHEDLEEVKGHLLEVNPEIRIHVRKADLSQREDIYSFARFSRESLKSIDVLVNNAGLYLPGKVTEEEDGALEKLMHTNVYSAYYLTKGLLSSIIEAHGRIINMASIASLMAYPNSGSYSISKFALRGFSMVLREELKAKGVGVTTVMPGATWSNSWAGVELPYERLMPPEDIAKTIYNCVQMSPSTVVEEIILRPQLGDL